MARSVYATIGRAPDNDVVLEHRTVSNHHARLSWSGSALLLEDLSSANGTYLDGQRVKTARTRPGADLRLGEAALPWSHQGLRALLKAGTGERTLVMGEKRALSYVCGSCGHVGELQAGPVPPKLTCQACGTSLRTGSKPRTGARARSTLPLLLLLGASAAGALYFFAPWEKAPRLPKVPGASLVEPFVEARAAERLIGGKSAAKIASALTPMDPVTRNAAVKLAARTQGPFHVEQVAEIWGTVRKSWRYVNDPEGREYFATASESIENGYIGDCDDFAITLASMVIAIGGKARVIIMDGPNGGHAYAEACVQGEPPKVARALIRHYRNRFRRYIKGAIPKTIAFRSSAECPIWLNLDWNSFVPGGPYEPEKWAVAVYEDGRKHVRSASTGPRQS